MTTNEILDQRREFDIRISREEKIAVHIGIRKIKISKYLFKAARVNIVIESYSDFDMVNNFLKFIC